MVAEMGIEDQSVWGHYLSGTQKVSKLEGLIALSKKGIEPTFHLYDELWDQTDLTAEPVEDLEELYAQRARDIRKQYDYLILSFSGGTDSEHVFRTFYKNGIFLDEIMHYHYNLNYRDQFIAEGIEHEGYEHEKLALPLLKLIKEVLSPSTRISIIDYTQRVKDFYTEAGPKWFEKENPSAADLLLSPKHIWKADPIVMNPHWADLINSGKKLCVIAGKEKIEVKKDLKGWYFQFVDRPWWKNDDGMRKDLPIVMEMFYTHPTTIKMQLKQAHLFKRKIQSDNTFKNDEVMTTRYAENLFTEACYGDRLLPLPYIGVKGRDLRLMYGPSRGISLGASNEWFFRDPDAVYYKNWMNMVNELYMNMPNLYRNAEDLSNRGFKFIPSKKHYIEIFKND
jgi:hypothetical protein